MLIGLFGMSGFGRSREGAWIEISRTVGKQKEPYVAPARERGLKCSPLLERLWPYGRSREGAWIEIIGRLLLILASRRRSREGAWIEINSSADYNYKLGRRSREGAWIEIISLAMQDDLVNVAPARERGLKFRCLAYRFVS